MIFLNSIYLKKYLSYFVTFCNIFVKEKSKSILGRLNFLKEIFFSFSKKQFVNSKQKSNLKEKKK